MKTITVNPTQQELNEILDQARGEDLMLETADGAQFMVTAVDDLDLEIVRTRQNKELMAFLEDRARQPATISLEEIERELGMK